ncbi:MAG: hypothetical protein LBS25_02845 [Candidatus Symbiothrix sp.]|jgi:hypothetical protein|nr:hypothetical protein [Candidatus Symbiothrix sp.]
MKKTLSILFGLVCCLSIVAQVDLYVRFNSVPVGSGIKTGSINSAITFDDQQEPTDAYKMLAPVSGDIYTFELELPVGSYQYQTVLADGSGVNYQTGTGREFTVSESAQTIHFWATQTQTQPNKIRFICDAQRLRLGVVTNPVPPQISAPDTNGDATGVLNYGGASDSKVQCYLWPGQHGELMGDIIPNSPKKWNTGCSARYDARFLFVYNYPSLSVSIQKLLNYITDPQINIGNGLVNATELPTNLGYFSSENPLLFNGKMTGRAVNKDETQNNDNIKITAENVTAKLYYKVIPEGEDASTITATSVSLSTTSSGLVLNADYTTSSAIDLSNELSAGDYTLQFWYETTYLDDILTTEVYSTAFTIGTPLVIAEDATADATNSYSTGDIIFNGNAQLSNASELSVSGVVRVVKTLATDQWHALCFPFAIDNISVAYGASTKGGVIYDGQGAINSEEAPTGGNAASANIYAATYDGSDFVLAGTTALTANTGYILAFPKSDFGDADAVTVTFTSEENPTLNSASDAPSISNYQLVANPNVANLLPSGATQYYQLNGNGTNFERCTSPQYKPFESYIGYVGSAPAKAALNIGETDVITGIIDKGLQAPVSDPVVETQYYNLQGVHVRANNYLPLQSGVYIVRKIHKSGAITISKSIIR